MQLVTAVWLMVAGRHAVPTVWQVPQVVLVIGATVCALAPLAGTPVAEVPLWQVVQLLDAVMPVWAKDVGFQSEVVWQLEHWA